MSAPLADRIRPTTLDEMVGQSHLLGKNAALRTIIDSGHIPNMIFYGPSGIGKTTLASIIAKQTNRNLRILNATTASTGDIKSVVDELDTLSGLGGILLYLDEIQYFNKKQQQTLLEHIENGRITLIASTTENPYFYVYGAILSRCTVFEFKPVTPSEMEPAITRAFSLMEQSLGITLTLEEGVTQAIAAASGGDVRKAVNAVELCALSARGDSVTLDLTQQLAQRSVMRYDKEGDAHYDILSAYQKSLRGSDPDAALHYLARLLEAGDLPSACRRLLVCASEDVGLAYPMIIPIVKAAVDTALQVGLPEARIPLADAVVLVATSPKSNSASSAIDAAMADVKSGKTGDIPASLKDGHYSGAQKMGHAKGYQYPHAFPRSYVRQQYLPDEIKHVTYYQFGNNKQEQAAKAYWDAIKKEAED